MRVGASPRQPVPLLDPCCGGGARRRLQGATLPARGFGRVRREQDCSPRPAAPPPPPSRPVPAGRRRSFSPAQGGSGDSRHCGPARCLSPLSCNSQEVSASEQKRGRACLRPRHSHPFFLAPHPLSVFFNLIFIYTHTHAPQGSPWVPPGPAEPLRSAPRRAHTAAITGPAPLGHARSPAAAAAPRPLPAPRRAQPGPYLRSPGRARWPG